MKRFPFAPQVISCYRHSLLQRLRRAASAALSRLTSWRI
jgi:hypothetical protein